MDDLERDLDYDGYGDDCVPANRDMVGMVVAVAAAAEHGGHPVADTVSGR